MNLDFSQFKHFVNETIQVVSLDLNAMEKIAESVNSVTSTIQTTTIRPGDEYLHTIESPQISRCTVPIAMICFSVIDMFGQWVNNYSDDDFAHSSSAFFKYLACRDDLRNETASNLFKKSFRHGVLHSFFANQGFSITYPSFEGNTLFLNLHGDHSTLDVKYLLRIVRKGIISLQNELLTEESELSQTAFEGYKRWLNRQESYYP